MPRATVDINSVERFELKTCPEGFVVLRRLSFGQVMERRMFTKLEINTGGKGKDLQGELAMANRRVTEFEFKTCIVEHNLEDESGRTLDLSTARDFNKLDPMVGQEIEKLISDMNNFEDEDEAGNSSNGSEQA